MSSAPISDPPKCERPGGQAGALRDQGTDSAPIVADLRAVRDSRRKRTETLRAQLALKGFELHELHELAGGGYLVTRWNCCRPLADLEAVAAFLRQVGGAA